MATDRNRRAYLLIDLALTVLATIGFYGIAASSGQHTALELYTGVPLLGVTCGALSWFTRDILISGNYRL